MLNKILKNIIIGVVLLMIITGFQFLISLLFQEDVNPDTERGAYLISLLLGLSAIPAFILSFFTPLILKMKTRDDIMIGASLWTLVFVISYVITGINNHTFNVIFQTIGLYWLFFAVFFGPVIFMNIKKYD
ncbi:MAG: hypothetical protein A2084_02375 [Tenericutes bacterium GWC2_39_45]|nr:MAG: hypothetical protein A2Y43_02910 [Tenericutes bacterium GWA2_38_26]OHE30294.1 MAG: hypothetical protein A2084_02375 [Tenericutes bacterium GWC2_39_45]OHE32064.1 MAG: hypothetical protein A2009_03010 [Tenericutes bacterium GWD2_38_27]OHE39965.1 MAG: hypothetical protein A2102_03695 [Tenericutes bacterium GWF2_38_8]HBG33741.1 hypothetical protein [Acholeplasmataceae bacterium]